jgi:S1-C subfamily serine protease
MALPALDVFRALDQSLAAAVSAAAPSVVSVARGRGAGTGIVWSSELAISSSFHTPDRARVGVPSADGAVEPRDAEVIGRDPGTDVALLRVAGGGLVPARLREIGELAVGNLALAVGRPGATARASLRAIGVLGGEVRTPWGGRLERYLESDRPIPRGFAGGPLIDVEGAVIGMNTRTLVRGADVAVPAIALRRVVGELERHGSVRRGYLGVGAYPAQLSATHAELAGRAAGGPEARAALVVSVDADGPAAGAGLAVGDLIIAIDAAPITGPDSLRAALVDLPGRSVTIALLRGGARLELSVELGSAA